NHIGQAGVAERVQNAWLKTIEDGVHTYDIYKEGVSQQKVGTSEFAQAVIDRLGQLPTTLKAVSYANTSAIELPAYQRKPAARKDLLGVDVFVHWPGIDPNELAALVSPLATAEMPLSLITNRGIKVWPNGFKETFCTDHWRCRFLPTHGQAIDKGHIVNILSKASTHSIDTIKTENLYALDGKPAFSMGQGQ
ncbi:MAG TPA: NADP-dependent isocitrate dehydrogenase, partial [Fibrella sp.]